MDYCEIRYELTLNASEFSNFRILTEIANLVNHNETHSQGRDLVIRALAQLDRFDGGEREILTILTRNVGLFPYMTESLIESNFEEKLAYELHRSESLGEDIIFHSLQAKIFNLLILNHNVVLSASTSVGKSLIIDALIATKKYRNIVLIVPTIALIDETRRRLLKRFGSICRVITHPSQMPQAHQINVYVLTQERVLQRKDLQNVDICIVDEFYKVNLNSEKDPSRSVDLNLAFHKLARLKVQFYLLGPNVSSISGLQDYEFMFVPSDFSTVAVDIVNFALPYRGEERKEKLLEILQKQFEPTIVYCQSPRSASNVAEYVAANTSFEVSADLDDALEWMSDNYDSDWSVTKALRSGIGVHHAGVPRALQQYFVRLFNQKKLRVLICTSTIIEGVNTVAKNVVIFDRRKGSNLLENFTYRNIVGRAGRMREHFVGQVFVLEKPIEETAYQVEFPIGLQDEDSPDSLLLDLEDSVLSPVSKRKLEAIFDKSRISPETLRINRHIPVYLQEAIYDEILKDLLQLEDALVWVGIPDGPQLQAVCRLIYDHLEGDALREYGVFSGSSLAWHINAIRTSNDISKYIRECVETRFDGQSPSDSVENCLRFIRNIVCFRFPRDLMAIDALQRDVFTKLDTRSGDYSLFAERVENMFLPASVFALDEYGIPIQTAQKIQPYLKSIDGLDEVLESLAGLDLEKLNLSRFEISLIYDVISLVRSD
ncbi:DEAD/DEAH box helicase [Loktanella sp. M215]|uniref:DEAD/DEAH box helicase n=1 Tax=Loktanella sp. M215 TaxID=2675431 RepID=UPI001F03156C|nr:DEAD/DEAH box helicase [Loktanella sp. M215]MCF7699225.1 DEAD/DEAH box helicase [Loktanella sp. M215]